MAEHGVFATAALWFGGYDLSTKLNAAAVEDAVEPQDDTTIADDTRSEAAGLRVVRFEGEGLFDSDNDGFLNTALTTVDVPLSFAIEGTTIGDAAKSMLAHQGSYQMGGPVGQLLKYQLSANGRGISLVHGYVMHVAEETASDDETGVQIGALSSSQTMHCALHVTAVSGTSPTLDVVVQSDDNAGFTSAVQRGAFTQASATGYEWLQIVGPQTDDYWRVSWTIGGSDTPTFTFKLVMGIV